MKTTRPQENFFTLGKSWILTSSINYLKNWFGNEACMDDVYDVYACMDDVYAVYACMDDVYAVFKDTCAKKA